MFIHEKIFGPSAAENVTCPVGPDHIGRLHCHILTFTEVSVVNFPFSAIFSSKIVSFTTFLLFSPLSSLLSWTHWTQALFAPVFNLFNFKYKSPDEDLTIVCIMRGAYEALDSPHLTQNNSSKAYILPNDFFPKGSSNDGISQFLTKYFCSGVIFD